MQSVPISTGKDTAAEFVTMLPELQAIYCTKDPVTAVAVTGPPFDFF